MKAKQINQEIKGRVPPQATDVEKLILGSILNDKEAITKVIDTLDESAFYSPHHQMIYRAMLSLFESSAPIDIVTVIEEMKKRGKLNEVEDPVYLTELSAGASSSANIEYHSRIVLEKALLRRLISSSQEIIARSFDESEDPLDLIDEAETKIFQVSEMRNTKSIVPLSKALHSTWDLLDKVHQDHSGITGVPSGFGKLDGITGGFQRSDLIIVAGRPSQGKTAFALSVAKNASMHSNKQTAVGIFSLEMSLNQLVIRLLSSEARVNAHALRTGKIYNTDEWSRISKIASQLTNAKIYIDDSPMLSIVEIRAKARRMKAEYGIGLLIVDYLQLVSGQKNPESREREISHISRSLKALAKELDLPVIALSQLNRSLEARTDKRPMLSDLRESGAIEQDADVVIFVHRPESYGIEKIKDDKGLSMSSEGIAEIIIGKQRNGAVGMRHLAFKKEYASFENLETIPQQEPLEYEKDAF